MHVRIREEQDTKIYELDGTLFFASAGNFQNLFDPSRDPGKVVVDFASSRVMDQSALEAIDTLAVRYEQAGKNLRLRHLSPDCLELLTTGCSKAEIDPTFHPRYHVADDRLG